MFLSLKVRRMQGEEVSSFIELFEENDDGYVALTEWFRGIRKIKNTQGKSALRDWLLAYEGKMNEPLGLQNVLDNTVKEEPKMPEVYVSIGERFPEKTLNDPQRISLELLFRAMDRNGDQRLESFELLRLFEGEYENDLNHLFGDTPEAFFFKLDINNDGYVSLKEWAIFGRRYKGARGGSALNKWLSKADFMMQPEFGCGVRLALGELSAMDLIRSVDPVNYVKVERLAMLVEKLFARAQVKPATSMRLSLDEPAPRQEKLKASLTKYQRNIAQALFHALNPSSTMEVQHSGLEAFLGIEMASEVFRRFDPPTLRKPNGSGKVGLNSWMEYLREYKVEVGEKLFADWLLQKSEQMHKAQAKLSKSQQSQSNQIQTTPGGTQARRQKQGSAHDRGRKSPTKEPQRAAAGPEPKHKPKFLCPQPIFPRGPQVSKSSVGTSNLSTKKGLNILDFTPPQASSPPQRKELPPVHEPSLPLEDFEQFLCQTVSHRKDSMLGSGTPPPTSSPNSPSPKQLSPVKAPKAAAFGRTPMPRPRSAKGVVTRPSYSKMYKPGTPEMTVHHVGVMRDKVYVQPYAARLTDVDMGEWGVWASAGSPEAVGISGSRWNAQTKPDLNLRMPHTCAGCLVSQLRCVHGDGLLTFSRSAPRLIVDPEQERHKIQGFSQLRQLELESWAALKLQAGWMGYKDRKVARVMMKQRRAAIRCQAALRGYLGRLHARKKRFLRTHAALTIQRVFRGMKGRRRFVQTFIDRSAAAWTLQRIYRGHLGRRRWNDVHSIRTNAALRIQGGYRGMVSRRQTKVRTRRRDYAIRKLQRVYRGRLGRRRFWEIHAIKSAAARTIQRTVRAWLIGHLVDKRIAGKKHLAATMQRVGRGRFGRNAARAKRLERDTAAAIKIQALLRGRIGRKRWVQVYRDTAATKIQSLVRQLHARGRVHDIRVENKFKMQRTELRIKCFMRWVQKRSQAARVLQRIFRGHKGRTLYKQLLRQDKATRIQRWMRSIFIHRILHSAVHSYVRVYRFYHKLVHPRLGVLRHYFKARHEAEALAEVFMNECSQMLARPHFFVGENLGDEDDEQKEAFKHEFGWRPRWVIPERWLMHRERLRLMQYMLDNKAMIRTVFLRCSMVLVSSPDKCFKVSKGQFEKLLRDTGLNKEISSKDIDAAWIDARKAIPKKVVMKTDGSGKKSIQGRGAKKAKKGGSEDQDMNLSQFIDMCLHLTILAYPAVDADGVAHSITDRFKVMLEERLSVLIADFSLDPLELEEGKLEEVKEMEEVKAVIAQYSNRLKKFYRKFGGQNKSGDDDMDIVEFMLALNAAKVIDSKLSNAKGLEVFVRCNQQEVSEYLSAMPDDKMVLGMCCEFEEFIDCIIMCADSQKKKGDTVDGRIGAFVERVLGSVQM